MTKDVATQRRSICSVTELARQLGLSRTRFYQLQKLGIFPMPLYCVHTRRPFYPLELQIRCLQTRRTGIGHNGRTILFYSKRKSTSKKPGNQSDKLHTEISDILRQMGLNVSIDTIKTALKHIYPEGLPPDMEEGLIIRDLFRHLK